MRVTASAMPIDGVRPPLPVFVLRVGTLAERCLYKMQRYKISCSR